MHLSRFVDAAGCNTSVLHRAEAGDKADSVACCSFVGMAGRILLTSACSRGRGHVAYFCYSYLRSGSSWGHLVLPACVVLGSGLCVPFLRQGFDACCWSAADSCSNTNHLQSDMGFKTEAPALFGCLRVLWQQQRRQGSATKHNFSPRLRFCEATGSRQLCALCWVLFGSWVARHGSEVPHMGAVEWQVSCG